MVGESSYPFNNRELIPRATLAGGWSRCVSVDGDERGGDGRGHRKGISKIGMSIMIYYADHSMS